MLKKSKSRSNYYKNMRGGTKEEPTKLKKLQDELKNLIDNRQQDNDIPDNETNIKKIKNEITDEKIRLGKLSAKDKLGNIGNLFSKAKKGLKEGFTANKEKAKESFNKNVSDDDKKYMTKLKSELKDKYLKVGDANPIIKFMKFFEGSLKKNSHVLETFTNRYIKHADTLHLLPRTILYFVSMFVIITEAILVLLTPLIESIPFIGKPIVDLLNMLTLPKEIYYLIYGFVKLILCIVILLSVIILIKTNAGCFDNAIINILYVFIVIIIGLLPYLYDLLSYIIHLAILDGFYRYKCHRDSEEDENVLPNKLVLIDWLKYGILFIGFISFIYYFLRAYLSEGKLGDDFIELLPLFMLLVPIFYLGINYLSEYIEKEISDVIVSMVGKLDDDIPEKKNCVTAPGSCENAGDSSITNLLKFIIYSVVCIVIIMIQKNKVSEELRHKITLFVFDLNSYLPINDIKNCGVASRILAFENKFAKLNPINKYRDNRLPSPASK